MKYFAIEPLEARIAPATLSIASAQVMEGDSGVKTLDFTVTLTGDITEAVTVKYLTADGTATTADSDYFKAEGILTFTPGGPTTQTVPVFLRGDTDLEQDQTFKVNLSNAVGATLEQAQATGTILTEELPTLSISDPVAVNENSGSVQFNVTLNGQYSTPITVNYATADGTAKIGNSDYTAKSGTLTFNPGQTSQSIAVALTGDSTAENDEDFFVDLTTPVGATIAKAQGKGIIKNDEPLTFTISSPQVTEGNAGTQILEFTVTMLGEITADTTINYATADGSAKTSDNDYEQTQGQLTFTVGGAKTQTIQVPIDGDTALEQDELFTVKLTNAQDTQLAQGTGRIVTDEQPTLSIDDPQIVEGTDGTSSLVFTVTLAGQISNNVTVNYATADGTALAGSDYTAVAAGLTFTPTGPATQTISVPLITDATPEQNETLLVNLTNAVGAALAKAQGTGTILNDEAPAFTIGNAQIVEGNAGTQNLEFTVTLLGDLTSDATVNYATANDTALAGEDFTTTGGLLTFVPNGPKTQTILVPILGDTTVEQDERFFVELSNPTGAALFPANAKGIGTITSEAAELPTLSIDDPQVIEGTGGTKELVFTVTLTGAINSNVTVNYATANGTATAGSDYTAVGTTLTFTPGQTTRTFTVPITTDNVAENAETLLVNLTNATGAAISKAQGSGTITNDDGAGFTISGGQITEGSDGAANLGFTVTLVGDISSETTVAFTTADGTAKVVGGDYTATGSTLTFLPGEAKTQTVLVPVIGDAALEQNETVLGKLSSPSNGATILQEQATGTILSDELPKFTIGDAQILEGNAGTKNLVFTVTLNGEVTSNATVKYATTDGTATAGSDYSSTTGTLTFAPGEPLTRTISVPIIGDLNLNEPDETFTVTLSDATGAIIDDGEATGTILDDERTLTVGSGTVVEGDSGNATMNFAVTLSAISDHDVVVTYSTVDGSATAGDKDYVPASGATITIPAGQTMGTISIPIIGDTKEEGAQSFSLNITSSDAAVQAATVTGTITDDDPKLSISDYAVTEGDAGTQTAVFTVTLAGASSKTIKVNYQTEDGEGATGAKDGVDDNGVAADYVAKNGTLTFSPGQLTKTISITVNNDLTHEEVLNLFKVKLSSAVFDDGDADESNDVAVTITDGTGIGTITDNGDAAPTVSINDVRTAENVSGGKAAFTVSLSGQSDLPVTVDFATVDGTAKTAENDYTAANGTLTFAPGATTQTINIDLTGDTTVEADETFSVGLSNAKIGAGPTPAALVISDATGVGTIRNDDLTVSVGDATFTEGAAGGMQFTVTLSGQAEADVVVRYSTTNGTAIAPGDYTAAAGDAFITILKGQLTGTITIPVINDAGDEPDETFTVTLTDATNAVVASGDDATATGTITDNDEGPLVSISNSSVTEGTGTTNPNLVFTVTLAAASTSPVEIFYKTVAGTATEGLDFTAAAAAAKITIPAGQTSATISIPVITDAIYEGNQNFTVQLTSATGATLGTTEAARTGTGTIIDDEAVPRISINDVSVAENIASGVARFTVTLSGASEVPITVNYNTANNGAQAGSDFQAASGTLTFLPERDDPDSEDPAVRLNAEVSKTIDVSITGDTAPETDEQFFVNLNSPTNAAIADGQGIGKILNDDATIRLELDGSPGTIATTVNEDGDTVVRFRVTLQGATPGATTTVQYRTVDGTDNTTAGTFGAESTGARPDFTAKSGSLVFDGTTNVLFIEIPITADSNYEHSEQFTLVLSQSVNAAIANGAGTGTVTIANNDAKPTLTIDSPSIVEGNSGTKALTFKAKLSAVNEVDANVTVNFASEDGTAISTGDKKDYTALTPGTLTFAPGELEKTIGVTIAGDLRDEDDQTFKVNLTNLSTGATFAGALSTLSGTGTITDDDATPLVTISNVTLGENDTGLPNTQFKISLVNAAGQAVESEKTITVQYTTANGTATAGSDFTATTGEVTFAPGVKEQTISIPVIDDTLAEDTETFEVKLTGATNATLGDASAIGTITDNDTGSRPTVSINDITFVEGANGWTNAIFTVALSGASGQTVTVNYATADGTGKASGAFSDYLAANGSVTFAPGELTKQITIEVIGDHYFEADETFLVNLSNPVNATLGDASGTATILNGGDTQMGLVLLDAMQVEDARVDSTNSSSAAKPLTFTALLSGPATSGVTFKLSTLNGTAIAGSDYEAKSETRTIAIGQSSVTFEVKIGIDSAFEATESFFVNLTDVSANVEVVDTDPFGTAKATARGYIFNDDINILSPQKIQWIDIDGDLVTLTVSKGALVSPLVSTDDLSLVRKNNAAGTNVGGYELQLLDLTNDFGAFAGANISIIATKQPGFPLDGDGRVDVGWIASTTFVGSELQAIGTDLGVVTVDGDLGKITAGDQFSTPAIRTLDVYSLGARGTTTQSGLPAGVQGTQSDVLGPITTLKVKQNVEGTVNVIGAEFGRIGTLTVGGLLKGGSAENSGKIVVTGSIGKATLGGIVGGSGNFSGVLTASSSTTSAHLGAITLLGDIVGGGGEGSGKILAPRIGNFTADSIIGGTGKQAGMIQSDSTLGNVTLEGDLKGGSGVEAGKIFAGSGIGAIKIAGSIVGGSSQDAGAIFTRGNVTSLAISGAIIGGSSTTADVDGDGASDDVTTGAGNVTVNGSLGATTIGDEGDDSLDSLRGGTGGQSGSLIVGLGIKSLTTTGNVRGGGGNESGTVLAGTTINKLAIGQSLIGGDAPALVAGSAAVSVNKSGYIQATQLPSVTIGGNIEAGSTGPGGLANSGAIRAQQIDKLTVNGDVKGQADNPVIVSALGGLGAQAIKNVLIKGKVEFAEILAGYDVNGTATNLRGDARNADASIGNVTIEGSVKGLNLVAGGITGADGRFGTADDRLIFDPDLTDSNTVFDNLKVIAQIASVVIKGEIFADAAFGVIAQHIVSLKTGATGTPLLLLKGAGNDVATSDTDPDPGVEIAPGTNFRALELQLPA